MRKGRYQIKNTSSDDMQKQMLKKLELSDKMHTELIGYCQEKDIEFMSTAFDLNSLNYLVEKRSVTSEDSFWRNHQSSFT